jgi:hypothetical protein
MLKLWACHLHTPRSTNRRVGDIAIPGNFIAGVDHHNTLPQIIGENASDLAQSRCLPDPGPAHQKQGLTAIEKIAHHRHRPEHRATNAAGQTHHLPSAVTDGTDPMQGSLNARPVIRAKLAETVHHRLQIGARDGAASKGGGPT